MVFRFLLFLCCLLFSGLPVFAQLNSIAGAAVSSAAAEQFLLEAEGLLEEERRDEALALLERGSDFADLSSDISYLLARVRYHEQFPLPSVLEALGRAFTADSWGTYSPSQGYMLEAEVLIGLRNYAGALRALDRAEEAFSPARAAPRPGNAAAIQAPDQAALLRLLALKGLADPVEFRRFLGQTMDRYPRDPRPVEQLFLWALDRLPGGGDSPEADRALMDLALRRLPFLLDSSPRLAYLAAPFIRDTEEARRLVAAYRSRGGAEKASLPVSLDLGLIGEEQAVTELFDGPALDRDLIIRVWNLLRSGEGRDSFQQELLGYSGLIGADADRDGRSEAQARYAAGVLREYVADADQDGLPELRIIFSAGGIPVRGEQELGGQKIHLQWERYPSVLEAELEGLVYTPAPGSFFFSPVRFTRLTGGAPEGESGLSGGREALYPETDTRQARLTPRILAAYARYITRPSLEFPGALERIELEQGIPGRAEETLDGRIVSVTEFSGGKARLQRLDMDLDGRMETIRYFRAAGDDPLNFERIPELIETDRDRDGLYEIGEQFLPDGTILYSWDSDGDGIRDYTEIRKGSPNHDAEP
ncbi:MAG: hypothetical protein LBQ46_09955 [Treponema sp.]|jgi:hypothetical protein|nr:hypothetical protein [Treponema sp.]